VNSMHVFKTCTKSITVPSSTDYGHRKNLGKNIGDPLRSLWSINKMLMEADGSECDFKPSIFIDVEVEDD
jgi:hypothetical protein